MNYLHHNLDHSAFPYVPKLRGFELLIVTLMVQEIFFIHLHNFVYVYLKLDPKMCPMLVIYNNMSGIPIRA